MKITDFHNISEGELTSRLLDWQKSVFSAARTANPGLTSELRFRTSNPLELLPWKSQVQYMKQYRDIIGLNKVLGGMAGGAGDRSSRIGNIWGGLRSMMGNGSSQPYGMFHVEDSGNSTLDRIYREMRLQYHDRAKLSVAGMRSRVGIDAQHHFGVGTRSIPVYHEGYGSQVRNLGAGKSFMTFDIETAGFMKNQIREVSYGIGAVAQDGRLSTQVRSSEYFQPRLFGRGSMGVKDTDGKIIPTKLSQFMHAQYGTPMGRNPDQFAERMTPFLHQINSVDYVMGHNIAGFDIEQIFTQLGSSQKYKSDSEFRSLVDKSFEALRPGSGKVIDTLQLARTAPNLANLQLAPELERLGRGGPYSIENLMLQTDLVQRMGISNTRKLLGAEGLHAGSTDLEITNAIAQHLSDLKPMQLGGTALQNTIRKIVLSSAAITPITDIRNQEHIADSVLRTMIDTGTGIEGGSKKLQSLIARAQTGDTTASQKAFDFIRSGRTKGIRFSVNPIEHEVLATRRLGMGMDLGRAFNPDDLMMNAGAFGRRVGVAGEFHSHNGVAAFQQSRLLGADEMSTFQDEMARRNMPFAGLSFEERRIGTSLASATSGVTSQAFDEGMGIFGNDLMVSHFNMFDPSAVAYATNSGRASMPASILQQAGILSDGSLGTTPASMLGLSSVEPTEIYPHRSMNLVYNFTNQEEVESLAGKLEELGNSRDDGLVAKYLGYGQDAATEDVSAGVSRFRAAIQDGLVDNIRSTGYAKGLSIGQLGDEAANSVNDILKEVSGLDQLSDRSMLAFRLPFMGMSMDERTAAGTLHTAGAVLNRGLGRQGLLDVSRSVQHTRNAFEAFKVLGGDAGKVIQAKSIAGAVNNEQVAKMISRYNLIQDYIRPNVGKGVLAAVALGAGLHFIKRHKEAQQYDATVAPMPANDRTRYSVADQLQMRMDSGYNGYYQKMNPLATASLPEILNSNRIGHTDMSPQRNNNLFSGAL